MQNCKLCRMQYGFADYSRIRQSGFYSVRQNYANTVLQKKANGNFLHNYAENNYAAYLQYAFVDSCIIRQSNFYSSMQNYAHTVL